MKTESMYSVDMAAKVIGKSRSSIIRAIRTGRLRSQKVGRIYWIDPKDLAKKFPNADQVSASEQHHQNGDQPAQGDNSAVPDEPVEPSKPDEVEMVYGETVDARATDAPSHDATDEAAQAVVSRPISHETGLSYADQDEMSVETVAETGETEGSDPNNGALSHGTFDQTANAAVSHPISHETGGETDTEAVETEVDACANEATQNDLLREQNDLLREVLSDERKHSSEQKDLLIAALKEDGSNRTMRITHPQTVLVRDGIQFVPVGSEIALTGQATKQPDGSGQSESAILAKLDEMHRAIQYSIKSIQALNTKRPSFVTRVLFAVPIAWCVLSGVYVAGFWARYGLSETVRYGEISYTALSNQILGLWPF